jgi:hypothetical protein
MKPNAFLCCAILLPFCLSRATAQQLIKVDEPPLGAAYYSLQKTNQPPLPFVPFKLDVYLWDRTFFFDDLDVDYEAVKSASKSGGMNQAGRSA